MTALAKQGIDENDQAILDSFMPSGSGAPPGSASGPFGFGGSRNLADIIMQKIQEREAGGGAAESDGERVLLYRLECSAANHAALPL